MRTASEVDASMPPRPAAPPAAPPLPPVAPPRPPLAPPVPAAPPVPVVPAAPAAPLAPAADPALPLVPAPPPAVPVVPDDPLSPAVAPLPPVPVDPPAPLPADPVLPPLPAVPDAPPPPLPQAASQPATSMTQQPRKRLSARIADCIVAPAPLLGNTFNSHRLCCRLCPQASTSIRISANRAGLARRARQWGSLPSMHRMLGVALAGCCIGACALIAHHPQKLPDGSYQTACDAPLSSCLQEFETLCEWHGYDVIAAGEKRTRPDIRDVPNVVIHSEARVRCKPA